MEENKERRMMLSQIDAGPQTKADRNLNFKESRDPENKINHQSDQITGLWGSFCKSDPVTI